MIKVLVVDDDKLVRKGLISVMPWQDFDMQVIGEASNGKKALEFLETNPTDLLLTDLAMPVMSGIELMRTVRTRFPHIHIVVLTLHQDFEYVQEALRLGAIDYIAKVELEKEKFEEVLDRIYNRILQQPVQMTSDRFYDYDPGNQKTSLSIGEWEEGAPDASYQDEGLQLLKEQWSSHEWIHHDLQFNNLLDEVKRLRLPQAKLIGLLYSLTDEWNRLFYPLSMEKIELKASFDSWHQVEAWLHSIRRTIRQAMDKPSYSQEVIDCVMRAVTMIHEEVDSQVTAAGIAGRVNMSRSYFSQCFKDITGKTFNDYLRHARIEKAKEYLLYTNKTILWIAENTGYMDEKYFSRTFREQTGVLPSEYRVASRAGRDLSGK